MDASSQEINDLKRKVLEGSPVTQFGKLADEICNSVWMISFAVCPLSIYGNFNGFLQALEQFSAEAPIPDDDMENEALYDKKVSL